MSKRIKSNVSARTIHNWVTLFLQVIIVIGLAAAAYERQWLTMATASGILLLTTLPLLLARRFSLRIPPEFELMAIGFIFAALFLGEMRGYYARFWWWDLALHTTSGGLLGIVGFLLIYILNESPRIDLHMRPSFVAVFAFSFSVCLGALWEIFEFSMDQLMGMNMQKPMFGDPSGLTDTMWDIIVDSVGALIIAGLGWWRMRRGQRSFVDGWITDFVQQNPRLFPRGNVGSEQDTSGHKPAHKDATGKRIGDKDD